MTQYRFRSQWTLDVSVIDAFECIRASDEWPKWWKGVDAVEGAPGGVGSRQRYRWRGPIPYPLAFSLEVTVDDAPARLGGIVEGDLEGVGRWRFEGDARQCTVYFAWDVETTKLWMNLLAPIARPIFRFTHDRIMANGAAGLARRLGATHCRAVSTSQPLVRAGSDASRWSHTTLDALRHRGDPDADRLAQRLREDSGGSLSYKDIVRTLLERQATEPRPAGDALDAFLRQRESTPSRPTRTVSEGRALFEEYAPEILVILGCYALPMAYAARHGAKVLASTHRLVRAAGERLADTFRMVIDVMCDDVLRGIEPSDGTARRGIEAARRVRLLHGAVRQMLAESPDLEWDEAACGVPINQEDLLGTLMTFAWITIDGLRRIGVHVSPREAQGYLDAWCEVGRALGIAHDQLPETCEEAQALSQAITRRQLCASTPNPDGRLLTRALVRELELAMPGTLLDPAAVSMIRMLVGHEIADSLGLTRRWPIDSIVAAYFSTRRLRARFLRERHPRFIRRSSRVFIREMSRTVHSRGADVPDPIAARGEIAGGGPFRGAFIAILKRWLGRGIVAGDDDDTDPTNPKSSEPPVDRAHRPAA